MGDVQGFASAYRYQGTICLHFHITEALAQQSFDRSRYL